MHMFLLIICPSWSTIRCLDTDSCSGSLFADRFFDISEEKRESETLGSY